MMKGLQKINIVFLFLLGVNNSFACDVCSCGASNSTSFTGSLNSNYIGFSYNYLHFSFREGIVDNSPIADDYINTINILGQYFVTDKIQINTVIPYRLNKREASTGNISNDGIGDITVYGLIGLLSKQSHHSLKVGAGLKLPTGTFNLQRAIANQTSATQLGTGSLDIMLPVQYKVEIKDFTFDLNGTYFIKNKNEEDFKFGNQIQLNVNTSYAIGLRKNNSITPSIGLNYDHFKATERFEVVDKRTSGYMTTVTFGARTNIKKVVVGLTYQVPIKQNLIKGEVTFKKGIGLFTYIRF